MVGVTGCVERRRDVEPMRETWKRSRGRKGRHGVCIGTRMRTGRIQSIQKTSIHIRVRVASGGSCSGRRRSGWCRRRVSVWIRKVAVHHKYFFFPRLLFFSCSFFFSSLLRLKIIRRKSQKLRKGVFFEENSMTPSVPYKSIERNNTRGMSDGLTDIFQHIPRVVNTLFPRPKRRDRREKRSKRTRSSPPERQSWWSRIAPRAFALAWTYGKPYLLHLFCLLAPYFTLLTLTLYSVRHESQKRAAAYFLSWIAWQLFQIKFFWRYTSSGPDLSQTTALFAGAFHSVQLIVMDLLMREQFQLVIPLGLVWQHALFLVFEVCSHTTNTWFRWPLLVWPWIAFAAGAFLRMNLVWLQAVFLIWSAKALVSVALGDIAYRIYDFVIPPHAAQEQQQRPFLQFSPRKFMFCLGTLLYLLCVKSPWPEKVLVMICYALSWTYLFESTVSTLPSYLALIPSQIALFLEQRVKFLQQIRDEMTRILPWVDLVDSLFLLLHLPLMIVFAWRGTGIKWVSLSVWLILHVALQGTSMLVQSLIYIETWIHQPPNSEQHQFSMLTNVRERVVSATADQRTRSLPRTNYYNLFESEPSKTRETLQRCAQALLGVYRRFVSGCTHAWSTWKTYRAAHQMTQEEKKDDKKEEPSEESKQKNFSEKKEPVRRLKMPASLRLRFNKEKSKR
jgi:hypothetical protein